MSLFLLAKTQNYTILSKKSFWMTILNRAMSYCDTLRPAMTNCNTIWPKTFSVWALQTTMTQNLVNGFTMTQNKLAWLFIFRNLVPKLPILAKLCPETWKCFALNETQYLGIFKGADSTFDDYFLKYRPENTFFEEIWSSKFRVLWFKWNSVYRGLEGCWFWI